MIALPFFFLDLELLLGLGAPGGGRLPIGSRVGGAAARAAPGVEGVGGAHLGLLVEAQLSEEKGTSLEEGDRCATRSNGRNGMTKTITDAAQHIDPLIVIADGLDEITQLVGEFLEPVAVLRDRHLTPMKIAELGLDVDGARDDVVVVDAFDGAPNLGRRVVGLHDEATKILRHGGVEPVTMLASFMTHSGLGWRGREVAVTWWVRPNFVKTVSKKRRHWE